MLGQVKQHALPVLYLTKTFAVETSYTAVICYMKAHQCNSAIWSHSNEPLQYYYYYVSPPCCIKAEGNGWGIQWIINVVLFSILHKIGYDRVRGRTANTQCYQVVRVSSDTAQISCKTVTQYCSVFCLIAVTAGYCGCGWFRFTEIYKEGAIMLLEESTDSGVGCHFAPSNMHPFVYQRCKHRCRSVRTLSIRKEKTKVVSLPWSYMQLWSKESYELGHWIRSVSREPQSIKQFCGGAYWICK